MCLRWCLLQEAHMGNADPKEEKNTNVGEDGREECHRPGRSDKDDDECILTCGLEQSQTISFNFELVRVSSNSRTATSRTLIVKNFPISVAALKLAIQEEFEVPVYDQKLSFDCSVMVDEESLDFYRLKDGDQITLEYTTIVDVKCAYRLIWLLRNDLEFVKKSQSQLTFGKISRDCISDTLRVEEMKQCIDQLSTNGFINFKFLLINGALDVVTELHSLLLKQKWDKVYYIDLYCLEERMLFLTKELCAVTLSHLRHKISNCLKNVTGSFLRVPISSIKTTLSGNPYLPSNWQHKILLRALHTLNLIAQDEHNQVQIASDQNVMKQLIGCFETPYFNIHTRISALICIQHLAYNPSTHKSLSNVELIRTIMKVADIPSAPIHYEGVDPELCSKLDSDLAKYYGFMVISHLALTKAAPLPVKLRSEIEFFLYHYLRSIDIEYLCVWILKARGMVLNDMFPPLRLVYCSLRYTSLSPIDSLCLEAAVLRLQIVLGKDDDERQCLIKQGLLDYLICLPWHINEELGAYKRARNVLEIVGSHIPLQPPTLNNIVRAKLAATWCGLEEAMSSQLVRFCREVASSQPQEGHFDTIV